MRQLSGLASAALLLLQSVWVHPALAETLPMFTFYGIRERTDDPVPVIVTYELKKTHEAKRAIARNPKAFWIHQIVARLEASKIDPPKALKATGIVRLSFVVAHDGHIVTRAVSTSSGSSGADQAAVAMLQRAQPFPPMPDDMNDQEMSFDLPVRFR